MQTTHISSELLLLDNGNPTGIAMAANDAGEDSDFTETMCSDQGVQICERFGIAVHIGDCVEVDGDVDSQASGKPWLARILSYRRRRVPIHSEDGTETVMVAVDEVQCGWLWHPRDAQMECPTCTELFDISYYGDSEVLLGVSLADWNAVDSIVRPIRLVNFNELSTLPQWPPKPQPALPNAVAADVYVWYYRQTFNADHAVVSPPLPRTVVVPNPAFQVWCAEQHMAPAQVRYRLPNCRAFASSISGSPEPVLVVPENPERRYFRCTCCGWLYESEEGLNSEVGMVAFYARSSPSEDAPTFMCPDCFVLPESDRDVHHSAAFHASAVVDAGDTVSNLNWATDAVLVDDRKRHSAGSAVAGDEEQYSTMPTGGATLFGTEVLSDGSKRIRLESPSSTSGVTRDLFGADTLYVDLTSPVGVQTRSSTRARRAAGGGLSGDGVSLLDHTMDNLALELDLGGMPATAGSTGSGAAAGIGLGVRGLAPAPVESAADVAKRQMKAQKFAELLYKGKLEIEADGKECDTDVQQLAETLVAALDAYCDANGITGRMAHQRMHERYQNLKRENNTDLRLRLLTGEMTPQEFGSCDAKDLAPDFLKKKREQEAARYFQQQVLLSSGPGKIIRKTHKGLEFVDESGTRGSNSSDVSTKNARRSRNARKKERAAAAAQQEEAETESSDSSDSSSSGDEDLSDSSASSGDEVRKTINVQKAVHSDADAPGDAAQLVTAESHSDFAVPLIEGEEPLMFKIDSSLLQCDYALRDAQEKQQPLDLSFLTGEFISDRLKSRLLRLDSSAEEHRNFLINNLEAELSKPLKDQNLLTTAKLL